MSYQQTAEGVRALLQLETMRKEGILHTKIEQVISDAGKLYRERPEAPAYTTPMQEAKDIISCLNDLYNGLVTARMEELPSGRERRK